VTAEASAPASIRIGSRLVAGSADIGSRANVKNGKRAAVPAA
jgi:hypothetical protein